MITGKKIRQDQRLFGLALIRIRNACWILIITALWAVLWNRTGNDLLRFRFIRRKIFSSGSKSETGSRTY
jgi:hypothetical protein